MTSVTGNGGVSVDLSWKSMGACRAIDPELFFPPSDTEAEPAVAVCRRCPVLHVCLQFALDNRDYEGVWGGTTGAERRSMVRKRRAATAVVAS